jgi:hypothetical protein
MLCQVSLELQGCLNDVVVFSSALSTLYARCDGAMEHCALLQLCK